MLGFGMRAACVPALLLLGCTDYGLDRDAAALDPGVPEDFWDAESDVDVLEPAAGATAAVYEEVGIGVEPHARCLLEAGFWRIEAPPRDPGAVGAVIERAVEPGTCVLTRFPDDQTQAAAALGTLGALDAGPYVRLQSGTRILDLPADDRDEDVRRYRMEPCDPMSYPFGENFDLSTPGTTRLEGLEAFTLREGLFVGPRVRRVAPPDESAIDGIVHHRRDEALDVAWEEMARRPRVRGRFLQPVTHVTLRHMRRGENRLFEALSCMPDQADSFLIPAEELLRMEPDDGSGDTYVALQVDVGWMAPVAYVPWGGVTRRSTASWSGLMYLLAE
jgi:hypothetical protein